MTDLHIEPGKIRDIAPRDVAIRFAFGAAVSVVAGLVSVLAGAEAGGVFLAFPAILPATLTLLRRKEGNDAAVEDMRGAIYGALGLVAFAVVAAALLDTMSAAAVLPLALAAWVAVSFGAFFAGERIGRALKT